MQISWRHPRRGYYILKFNFAINPTIREREREREREVISGSLERSLSFCRRLLHSDREARNIFKFELKLINKAIPWRLMQHFNNLDSK